MCVTNRFCSVSRMGMRVRYSRNRAGVREQIALELLGLAEYVRHAKGEGKVSLVRRYQCGGISPEKIEHLQ